MRFAGYAAIFDRPDRGGPHAPYRQSERLEIYRMHAARTDRQTMW